jgi:SAM-dependent methyltransferase
VTRAAAIANRSYGRSFAEAYDNVLGDAAAPTIIAGVRQAIARHALPAGRIADIGCGTGRLLEALATPGRSLIGVDLSPFMLRVARRRLGGTACLLRQDMRGLALPAPVDLLLCCFATLNYLTGPDELDRTFAAFARNLRVGGHLIADFIPHIPSAAPAYRLSRRVETGAGPSIWRSEVDPLRGLTRTWVAFPGHDRSDGSIERHVQRWLPIRRVGSALKAHGLQPIDLRRLRGGGPTQWVGIIARREEAAA